MVLIEAMAHGLPIITSRLGGMQELVQDMETGLLFEPGNDTDLNEKVQWALNHPDEMQAMGERGRAASKSRFGAEENYRQLRDIYDTVIAEYMQNKNRSQPQRTS
jgi:glycosyltransferase involved in cell wall biosynthesis